MNAAHFHLIANHIVAMCVVLGLPLLVWGSLRGNLELCRAALIYFLGAALLVVPLHRSGEGMEGWAERLPGGKVALEAHDRAGDLSLALTLALGAAALAALLTGQQRRRALLLKVVLLLAILDTASLVRTGYLGGQIRHDELTRVQP